MLALAWPLSRVAAFGQTASQGLGPIAHTLAAFGPGLLGYGIAFVMTRVLFSIGDVRVAALLMIAGAVLGVAWMIVGSAIMAPGDRAMALAIGYGVSQSVAAVLLTLRVHRITGSMGARVAARLLAESLVAGAAAVVTMLWVVAQFGTRRRQAAVAMLFGGVAGVVVFAAVMASARWREVARRRMQELL
jgi:putative peptidoglycan lipid II flippase